MPTERVDVRKKPNREPRLIDLALQGGGSHGAFTWGVLDRMLEEPHLKIDAISGTSAGAMNAAVLADGWTVVTTDGSLAAHFEHTIAVTEDGVEILTVRS